MLSSILKEAGRKFSIPRRRMSTRKYPKFKKKPLDAP